jgi:hypothetical protein
VKLKFKKIIEKGKGECKWCRALATQRDHPLPIYLLIESRILWLWAKNKERLQANTQRVLSRASKLFRELCQTRSNHLNHPKSAASRNLYSQLKSTLFYWRGNAAEFRRPQQSNSGGKEREEGWRTGKLNWDRKTKARENMVCDFWFVTRKLIYLLKWFSIVYYF